MTATPMVGSTFFGLDISQLSTQLLSLRRRVSKRVLVLEFGPDFLLLAEAMPLKLSKPKKRLKLAQLQVSLPLQKEAKFNSVAIKS